MVERVIKNDITPMPRYKDEYIVAMTEEENPLFLPRLSHLG